MSLEDLGNLGEANRLFGYCKYARILNAGDALDTQRISQAIMSWAGAA